MYGLRYAVGAVVFLLGVSGEPAWARPAASMPKNPIHNGGFETAANHGGPAGWRVVTRGRAQVRVARRPFWVPLARGFNSGPFKKLRIYLRLQMDRGTVWFDDVTLDGIPLKNPGFEETNGNRFPGWGQDNAGRTIFADRSGVARSGRGCLRISQSKSVMSRVWQDVACRPHQNLTLRAWARAVPPRGRTQINAYIEVYGIKDDGSLGPYWSSSRISCLAGPGPGVGRGALELRAGPGAEAAVEQELAVPWSGRAILSCWVMPAACRTGRFEMTAAAVPSGRRLGASLPISGSVSTWLPCAMPFRIPEGGRVRIVLRATGPADLVRVDDVRLLPFTPEFPVQDYRRPAGKKDLQWAVGRPPMATGLPDAPAVRKAWRLLVQSLKARGNPGRGQAPPVRITVSPTALPADIPGPEAYRLTTGPEGVRIAARTPVGVRWALITLLGLGNVEGDLWRAPACEIRDWPDLPFRATYRAGIPWDAKERARFCERLMRLKINALVMEDNTFFHMTDPGTARKTAAVFDDIRAWGIDPIPEMQGFGHAGIQIRHDPRLAEGKEIRGERLVLHGTTPAPLAHKNVIRTRATDVVLTSPDGRTRYTLGRDYAVLDGTIAYGRPDKAKPFLVRRLPGSRIPDGAAVSASYDVVAHGGSYCPSEPAVYAFCLPQLRAVIRTLHPKIVHIGHDEPRRMNSDSRCRRRHLSETALIAEDLRRWDQAAHAADPRVRLMMWADPLNPYHNGRRVLKSPTDFERVPKDIIQCVWFYSADEPLRQGLDSIAFFAEHGIPTTGSPWYNVHCATNWGRAARAALRRKYPFLGLLYTSWSRRWDALAATAKAAWKLPAPGPGSPERR